MNLADPIRSPFETSLRFRCVNGERHSVVRLAFPCSQNRRRMNGSSARASRFGQFVAIFLAERETPKLGGEEMGKDYYQTYARTRVERGFFSCPSFAPNKHRKISRKWAEMALFFSERKPGCAKLWLSQIESLVFTRAPICNSRARGGVGWRGGGGAWGWRERALQAALGARSISGGIRVLSFHYFTSSSGPPPNLSQDPLPCRALTPCQPHWFHPRPWRRRLEQLFWMQVVTDTSCKSKPNDCPSFSHVSWSSHPNIEYHGSGWLPCACPKQILACPLSRQRFCNFSFTLPGDLALKNGRASWWIFCGLRFPGHKARKILEKFGEISEQNSGRKFGDFSFCPLSDLNKYPKPNKPDKRVSSLRTPLPFTLESGALSRVSPFFRLEGEKKWELPSQTPLFQDICFRTWMHQAVAIAIATGFLRYK